MSRQSCLLAKMAVRSRLSVVWVVLLTFCFIPASRGNVVTFDDLPVNDTNPPPIPAGYQGLIWSNFNAVNVVSGTLPGLTNSFMNSGYYNGMISPSNVVYNEFADPAEIDLANGNFDFLSAYLTAAWTSNLNVLVRGFSGAAMLYSTNVVVDWTGPTLVDFNFQNIDRLTFNSFGGQDAGLVGYDAQQFVMDNFSFAFDPAPPGFVSLAIAGTNVWLSFPTLYNVTSNIFYDVQSTTNLVAGAWSTIASNIAGTGGIVSYTNSGAAVVPRLFYRVGAHY
jgi:hypothetical protein